MATAQNSIFAFDQVRPARLTLLKGERQFTRYPLALSVRFESTGRAKGRCGAGVTRDLSSHGMFIETDREKAALGSRVKIVMDWPALLDGNVPLQFVARAQVVRCDALGFAVSILQHEYRTKRKEIKVLAFAARA